MEPAYTQSEAQLREPPGRARHLNKDLVLLLLVPMALFVLPMFGRMLCSALSGLRDLY